MFLGTYVVLDLERSAHAALGATLAVVGAVLNGPVRPLGHTLHGGGVLAATLAAHSSPSAAVAAQGARHLPAARPDPARQRPPPAAAAAAGGAG